MCTQCDHVSSYAPHPVTPRTCCITTDSTKRSAKTSCRSGPKFGRQICRKKKTKKKKHLFSFSQGAASTPGSATRSTRFWERGCGVHSKMRNVTAGQCEAQDSVLPLGTRPQAVCFCRNILNCPCTYVNTEHQDARSHHSERCRDGSHPLEASIQFIQTPQWFLCTFRRI